MYKPKYDITNNILKYIGVIEASKEVVENAPLVPAYETDFQKDALVRTVHFGTALEGNELSKAQAERFGSDVRDGWITKVDFSSNIHKVWINDTKEIHCQTVIISTGASAKYLGLESEQKYLKLGGGVSACAVCDGFFYRNQEVVIVGAGDSACEEAHYLSKLCSKVTMLVRRDVFRASKIMANRVKNTENIDILFNTETVEVLGDDQVVTGVKVKNSKTEVETEIPATGFFVAIGHKPNTDIFKDFLNLDETGYILNEPGTSRTNIEGVFVSGDAADHVYRQAITAAGTGCMAALDAERYLAAKEG